MALPADTRCPVMYESIKFQTWLFKIARKLHQKTQKYISDTHYDLVALTDHIVSRYDDHIQQITSCNVTFVRDIVVYR